MLSNTQLTLIRTAATAVVTGLAVIQPMYPDYTWIPAVLAVGATVGIHAIPSITQNTVTKGNTMTEPTNGLVAMGLQPPAPEAPQPAEQTPATPQEAPQTTAGTPETPVATQAVPEVSPAATAPVAPDNSAAKQALEDAANALLKIEEGL